MENVKTNLRKIILYILIIIVAFLVIAALYFNRYKFSGLNTIRYKIVNIERGISINELAGRFSDNNTRSKFVSETKRLNNINSTGYIPGNSTLIIPIIEYE
jgi:cell division protein YceG involved in septum cleavage